MWKVLAIAVFVIVLAGGGWLIYSKKTPQPQTVELAATLETTPAANPNPESSPFASQLKPAEQANAAISNEFITNLIICATYKTTFIHPLTGDVLEKEIQGMVDGKCNYTEQMPNNGRMDCKYTESMLGAIVSYHKDLASAEDFGMELQSDSNSGAPKVTYTIDGKEVENPLQEALDTGMCVISGY